MRIGTDFHGVIFEKEVAKAVKRMFDIDIIQSNYYGEIQRSRDVLTDQQYRAMRSAFHTYPIGLLMKPIKGAHKYLLRLQHAHTVHTVSSRDEIGLKIADFCCAQHDFSLDIKGVGRSVIDKSDAIKKLGLDVYADDELKKLIPLIGIVPDLFWFVPQRGRKETCPEQITRVDTWKDLYNKICTINYKRKVIV